MFNTIYLLLSQVTVFDSVRNNYIIKGVFILFLFWVRVTSILKFIFDFSRNVQAHNSTV